MSQKPEIDGFKIGLLFKLDSTNHQITSVELGDDGIRQILLVNFDPKGYLFFGQLFHSTSECYCIQSELANTLQTHKLPNNVSGAQGRQNTPKARF